MDGGSISGIAADLAARGLNGASEAELLSAFCAAGRAAGLPLDRAVAVIDTLHPVHEGRAFQWDSEANVPPESEYGPTNEGAALLSWQRSAFYRLWSGTDTEIRRRLGFGDPADFSMLDKLAEAGHTDFIALGHRFSPEGTIGEMDCFLSYFATRHPDGFREGDVEALRALLPTLALAIKCTALARIARTIAEVYLGEDAAGQVLSGKIRRGQPQRISAVIWFSDLLGYTKLSDSAAPDEVLALLDDYGEAVISAVHAEGGNVLKLIGDGVLAIFKADAPDDASCAALRAERRLRERLAELNASRRAENRPTTDVYIGLHIGEVFYGNIGSEQRLDFTVIGPAVNEVSRIASMCRSVDVNVLMSTDFFEALPAERRASLACVGRFALRGVQRIQSLHTLEAARLLGYSG